MEGDLCVTTIPVLDSIKIHVFSFFIGGWIVLKRLLKWAWDPNSLFSLQKRDSPPQCLVDSNLGQHSYVKIKGIKFHYVETGRENKHLLLLLHGFADCWLTWRYQIQTLSEHFHVIALDLKGFGDSDKPLPRKSYRIEILLSEIKQFINAVNPHRCTIIGHDLGALIGWYFIHKYPESVDKFISVSCTHPNLYWQSIESQNTFNNNWVNFIQLPYLPEMDALKEDLKVIEDYYKHLQVKDCENTSVLEAYKYSFSRQEDWTGPINYYRNLPFIRISEKCRTIVPVLFITGNKDEVIKLEGIIKSTDYCDKFTIKIVEGTGHFPHQEKPDVFNKFVLEYLHVREQLPKITNRVNSRGLMNRMFGAVTSTVKYGNSVFDSVQKSASDVISIPSKALNFNSNS